MKTLLSTILAGLLMLTPQQTITASFPIVASAGPTISPVGTAFCSHTTSGGATSLTTSSYTAVAAGDTILLAVDMLAGSVPAPSVTDSGSYNTYTQPSTQAATGSYYYAAMFGALSNTHAGAMTFTASPLISGSGTSVCVQEYSGAVAYGNTITTTGTSVSTYSASVTTQDPNNYVACSVSFYGQGTTPTAINGVIRAVTTADNGGFIQDNHSATAGTVTVSGTFSASQTYSMTCVELRTV